MKLLTLSFSIVDFESFDGDLVVMSLLSMSFLLGGNDIEIMHLESYMKHTSDSLK